ncbi:hypothetical protein QFC21_003888 [Naganishia friedmannii]|uniref:Uncharacterized protein n=1 Tax=Naganishia friedmannii TaxID=89922 RepID=A0ACC2VL49_9TREE|nr:hypothetical protein QFC21_003888 [Naganishia friedmannii]
MPLTTSITYTPLDGSSFSKPKHTILIYGATSYTARLLIDYLATHPERKQFTFALAGRNPEKLKKLVDDLHQANEDGEEGRTEWIACALEDTEEGYPKVAAMVSGAEVVINLAGPYSSHNAELLVRACAELGRHYIDLTGETFWIKEMIEKYDYLASKTHAIIVPSCGFDSIPSDILAYQSALYLARLNSSNNAEIESSQTFFNTKGGVSGGTIASFKAMTEVDPYRIKRSMGEFALVPAGASRGVSSIGLRPYYSSPLIPAHGSFFVMGPVNTAIVRRSWSLFRSQQQLASQGSANVVTYGDKFTYSESQVFDKRGGLGSRVTAWLQAIFFRMAPQPGSGPSEKTLRGGWLEGTNVSKSSGNVVVSTMKGQGDPGYWLTSHSRSAFRGLGMLVESALSLTLSHGQLSPIAQQGGVLTPAAAFGDVIVERLNSRDEFEIETMTLQEWRGKREGKKDI